MLTTMQIAEGNFIWNDHLCKILYIQVFNRDPGIQPWLHLEREDLPGMGMLKL